MPDEEDSGMLMLSINVVFTCMYRNGRKWGQWGLGQGTKKGADDSEHGASKGGRFAATYKEPPFQVRGVFLTLNIHKHHTCNNILCTI